LVQIHFRGGRTGGKGYPEYSLKTRRLWLWPRLAYGGVIEGYSAINRRRIKGRKVRFRQADRRRGVSSSGRGYRRRFFGRVGIKHPAAAAAAAMISGLIFDRDICDDM